MRTRVIVLLQSTAGLQVLCRPRGPISQMGCDLATGRGSPSPGWTDDEFVLVTAAPPALSRKTYQAGVPGSPCLPQASTRRRRQKHCLTHGAALWPCSGPENAEKTSAIGPCLRWESFSNLKKAFLFSFPPSMQAKPQASQLGLFSPANENS